MLLPDPLAIAAIKVVLYSGIGAVIRMRGRRKGNPIGFGLVRAILGWVVGVPLILAVGLFISDRNPSLIAVLAIPRILLSAFLIQKFFQPLGGRWEVVAWALVSVALASAADAALLSVYRDVSWLHIPWC